MPVMPNYVANQGLQKGPTPQVDTGYGAVTQGISKLASGIDAIGEAAQRYAEIQDKKTRFNTATNTDLVDEQIKTEYEEIKKNAPPDGSNIHAGWMAQVDKKYDDYLTTVPEYLQEETRARLAVTREGWVKESAHDEQAVGAKHSADVLNNDYENYKKTIANAPDKRDAAQHELFSKIDNAPYLSAADREGMKKNIRNGLELTEWQTRYKADPEAGARVFGRGTEHNPDALWRNMLKRENASGDPSAMSSKGALGIAQVMPGTAREVAAKLGLSDVAKMDDSQLRAYFTKHPEVNEKIGRAYLDQQLAKYGDAQAAVIAYNAGPAIADKWIESGRDDTVLPAETQAYKKAVLGPPTGSAGKANYTSVKTMGDPRSPGWVEQNIVPIRSANGQEWRVNRLAAPAFQGLLADLEKAGYIPKSSGGYDYRNIKGSTRLSQHAFGTAIDIDAANNPLGSNKTNLPANIGEIAAKWGLIWGGNWKNRPDPMHFEWAGGGAIGPDGTAGPPSASYEYETTEMPSRVDPRFSSITLEQQNALLAEATRQKNEQQAIASANLAPVIAAAQKSLSETGEYNGERPPRKEFIKAYGPEEGAKIHQEFEANIDLSTTTKNFRSMSEQEITVEVEKHKPAGSGPEFAVEQQKYQNLQVVAANIITARKASPADYVVRTNPAIAEQWKNANTPEGYQKAVLATAAYQDKLGIPKKDQQFLIKDYAESLVKKFNDPNIDQLTRIRAVTNALLPVQDKDQRQAIYRQLVASGLPETVGVALEPVAHGDEQAAKRLMSAVLVRDVDLGDKTKSIFPGSIRSYLQYEYAEVFDAAYGVRLGMAENLRHAANAEELLIRQARLYMIKDNLGMQAATDKAVDDLFGKNRKIMNSTPNGQATKIILRNGMGEEAVGKTLDAARSPILKILADNMERAATQKINGNPAVADVHAADALNKALKLYREGHWIQYEDGFAFVDPDTHEIVEREPGKPFIARLGIAGMAANVKPISRHSRPKFPDRIPQTAEEAAKQKREQIIAEKIQQQSDILRKYARAIEFNENIVPGWSAIRHGPAN